MLPIDETVDGAIWVLLRVNYCPLPCPSILSRISNYLRTFARVSFISIVPRCPTRNQQRARVLHFSHLTRHGSPPSCVRIESTSHPPPNVIPPPPRPPFTIWIQSALCYRRLSVLPRTWYDSIMPHGILRMHTAAISTTFVAGLLHICEG